MIIVIFQKYGLWHVREQWQRDQLEDYDSGTGRVDKGLIWLEGKQ